MNNINEIVPFLIIFGIICVFCVFMIIKTTKAQNKQKKPKKEMHKAVSCQPSTVSPVTIITDIETSAVPDDIAKEMRKYYTLMQAQRDAQIMVESFRLAGSTQNMDVFCMRYELALRKAHTLLQAEQVGVRDIKKLKCHDGCVAVINAAQSLKIRMLADFEQNSFLQAEALKTEKGKLNRYIKIKQILSRAESTFMFMDEYESLVNKVDSCIIAYGGILQ